jgi:hypothetical protein
MVPVPDRQRHSESQRAAETKAAWGAPRNRRRQVEKSVITLEQSIDHIRG